ncbi:hypothetical protein ACFQPA_14500 [Halomarina halobia]|uniref:Uncharacterized protein n=1 Tax=Halomarina halobia TaxID=3033386 RepID=A0ABD6A8G8_9EURY|nr:hypothetical protein [Halomarina sp. PSR21]
MKASSRRAFLGTLGSAALAGCLGAPSGGGDAVTLYAGAYHWGFVAFDESGGELDRAVVDRGASVTLVAFNTGAERVVRTLPAAIREALPDHETLEERNEGRVPPPRNGTLHERLEAANERYPDHSLAVMPSGGNHMGGMGGGMMMHPVALPRNASSPATVRLSASRRGDFTFSCRTYCGYGHPYMDLDGAIVVG